MKKGRLRTWLLRKDAARIARMEREAASARPCPGGSASSEADGVCADESKLPWGGADGSELEGSDLEVGGAMQGLIPLKTPEAAEADRKRDEGRSGSECDTCT